MVNKPPTLPESAIEEIPTLDFSPFYDAEGYDARTELCQALVHSLKRHGLAKLTNHGASPASIENAFELSRRFFSLPEEQKKEAAHPEGPNPHRGYCRVGLEKTYGVTGFERGLKDAPRVQDIKESFDIGGRGDSLYPNTWPAPAHLPNFREDMEGFYDSCHDTLCNIMDAVAIGLGLEPQSLAVKHSTKAHELRLLHYPAVDARMLDGTRLRIAEHTDFGTLTLLYQDRVGGLEVEAQHYNRLQGPETASGLPFRAVADSAPVLIVNIGDSLERWTNSYLRAVVHRVSRSPTSTEPILPDRYSIAFFGKPNREVSLAPLAPFVDEERKAAWGEVTAHDYNQSKLIRTFAA